MKKDKIDKGLLFKVNTLSDNNKLECIVKAYDYDRLKSYLHNKKIEVVHEYLFIKSFCITVSKKEVAMLSHLSQVEYIFSLSSACALMNVARKVLDVENSKLTGDGINIAFIDTGIKPHLDFLLGRNRLVYFKDFVNGRQKAYDDNGHGTFVSGVCSGSGALSGGKLSGIAPHSKILSLKALNGDGEASADRILDAMEWVYINHTTFDIKVVCMSFGSEPLGYNDPIMSGAEALWRSGVVVVAAAGNSGPEFQTIKSPGVSGQIITVGGFDDNRFDEINFKEDFFEIAQFSSRGPAFKRYKPDVIAPSVDITSCGINKNYTTLSGTSVATPMIAGLVALMLEREPDLRPDEIKRKLVSMCKAITYNHNLEGFGYPVFRK